VSAVFADTHYFLALLNPRDASHGRAKVASQNLSRRLVTSAWVLMEIGDGLADSANRSLFAGLIATLYADRRSRVVPFSAAVFRRAADLYTARRDKRWSLTDCTSFIIMQKLRLTDALTADHHFEQAGFHPLLRRS
jgi:uncharacterized protein